MQLSAPGKLQRAAPFLVLAAILALLPATALAHERRQVGPYTFVVGWINEPAIQGESNSLDLTVTDASGNPVEGAEKTLKVAIAFGGGTPKDLPLSARFGQKGKYNSQVIPTKAGSYAFVFSGALNGQSVNERFESGPGRFDDVTSPSTLQFPDVVPATADLAQQTQAADATAQAAMQRATLLGLGGIAVGLVGAVLAIVALIVRARPAPLEEDSALASPAPQR